MQLERRLGVDPPDVGERRADDRDALRSLTTQLPLDAFARREQLLALGDRVLVGAHRDVGVAEPHRVALRHLAGRPESPRTVPSIASFGWRAMIAAISGPRASELVAGHDLAHHADLVGARADMRS